MFSLGTAIISTIIYKTYRSRFFNKFIETRNKDDTTDITPYEDKYFKEYDEWTATATATATAHTNERLENMYYSTVRETINDFYGDIIMCYDAATFSFAYYARTANIPYKYLETVSRKYMIDTNAPIDIHVDIRKEYAKAKAAPTPTPASTPASTTTPTPASTPASTTTTETETEPDVFAKFKSYNTAPNITTNTGNNPNHQNTTTTIAATTTNSTEANTKIIRENANRYSYRGKISDFDTHHNLFLAHRRSAHTASPNTPTSRDQPQNETNQPENETYAEYKKRIGANLAVKDGAGNAR